MNTSLQKRAAISESFPSASGRVLQRKCSCGGKAGAGGECEECRKKKALQRKARKTEPEMGPEAEVPPIIHEVLGSPGQPLDEATRRFMEPRFRQDFGQVRVHTDARAGESAQAVNALAYTVGPHIVFDAQQYAPDSSSGRKLLAHELAHTVQQRMDTPVPAPGTLRLGASDSLHETQADSAAQNLDLAPSKTTGAAPSVQRKTWPDLPVYEERPEIKAGGCGTMKASMTPFVTGVEGKVAFTPDPQSCPKCKSIRLVQIVRVFEKPGQDYTFPGAEAPREQVKTKADADKGVKENFFVDHFAAKCSKGKACSVYYRDHAPNASKSQDGSSDGTTAKEASLWDRPSGDKDDIFEFETCALCADTGKPLKCLDWGFQADSAGKATVTPEAEHGVPSATFDAATAAFRKYYK